MNIRREEESPHEQVLDDIIRRLETMQRRCMEGAQRLGYAREVFITLRPAIRDLANAAEISPIAKPVYVTAVNSLRAYHTELAAVEQTLTPHYRTTVNLAGTAFTFATTTGSTYGVTEGMRAGCPEILPPTPPETLASYAERFSRLDPELSRTYEAIWEALYGTVAAPERSAMFLIRQAFDQLFQKLAPDDEVRKSTMWKPKDDEKANQIYKEERILFAAERHIRDPEHRKTMIESSRYMLEVYKALNSAHERGGLDRRASRRSLTAMQAILNSWADAMDL